MAVGFVSQFAERQGHALLEDPIDYFVKVSRKVGTGALIAGAAMGVGAYYLTAAATTAANNEMNVLTNIGTIFSNIKSPTFQPAPSGTAPLSWSVQGVQNFFGDAWSDVQAVGSDIAQIGAAMGTLAEDLANGIIDVAKSILAFVMHFPDILWNGVVWGVGGAIGNILTWAFPWFIIIGGVLLIASVVAQAAKALWDSTIGEAAHEAWAEKTAQVRDGLKAKFRKILRVHSPPVPESEGKGAQLPDINEPVNDGPALPVTSAGELLGSTKPPEDSSPPVVEVVRPAEVPETEPEEVGGAVSVADSQPPPEPEPAVPNEWKAEEIEEYLGKAREAEQDRAKAGA